jgi:hypothetical protein
MSFKGAFNCEKCPRSNDPQAERACPAWWETLWQDNAGETKVEKGCAFTQMQQYHIEVIRASNRPAASFDKLVNEMQNSFTALMGALTSGQPYNQRIPTTLNGGRSDDPESVRRFGELSCEVPERSGEGYQLPAYVFRSSDTETP